MDTQSSFDAGGAMSRRHFFALSGMAAAAGLLGAQSLAQEGASAGSKPASGAPFEVEPLPYGYDALEPWIDGETMHLHHDKHYATYTKNLNEALKNYPELQKLGIEELLSRIDSLPTAIRETVRNNGGGYYNHGLFWRMMGPGAGKNGPGKALEQRIVAAFGSVAEMKRQFGAAAASVFGSGWAWLIERDGKLEILRTRNQDSPLMLGIAERTGKPILGLDVWEHAYYLKYKNERAKYIEAWWNVVNWPAQT